MNHIQTITQLKERIDDYDFDIKTCLCVAIKID